VTPIPFFAQERPESCVPACLRMILATFNVVKSETEIYSCCQTDIDGTLPSAAVECAASFGFDARTLRLDGLESLQARLQELNSRTILFVNLASLIGVNVIHAVVLRSLDVQRNQIQILDPAFPPQGERVWSLDQFQLAWRAARYQTILILPPKESVAA